MMFDEVKKIILKIIDVDERKIKPETRFVDDLGADSLDMVEIGMAIEERFNIEIVDEGIEKIKTVGDMIKDIEERIKNKR